MNNNLNTNDQFEQLLQEEADKHRMYPSDKVWENIRVELHGKPKWPALFIGFILIVGALTIATVMNYPPHKFLVKSFDKNNQPKQPIAIINTPKISEKVKQHSIQKLEAVNQQLLPFIAEDYTLKANNFEAINAKKYSNDNDIHKVVVEEDLTSINENKVSTKTNITTDKIANEKHQEINTIIKNLDLPLNEKSENVLVNNDNNEDITETIAAANINTNKKNKLSNSDDAKFYLKQFKHSLIAKNNNTNNKWKLQYYLTPSVSYRRLEDDKNRLNYTTNQADRLALKSNVNDVVKHKASLGIEFGISALYEIKKHFFIKTGLQFNALQYGINAYQSAGQASFTYVQNNQLNTLSFQSAYTTKQGVNETKLENTMYQFSMPIGFQWDVVNGERWGLSGAATVQPTYTFNKNVYIVSTDYKHYADGTPFFRRWNVNTSAELYLTLKAKSAKWFFGPQVRYQQMPTYNDIYPIKEYRVDYGIKFGFIKSLH